MPKGSHLIPAVVTLFAIGAFLLVLNVAIPAPVSKIVSVSKRARNTNTVFANENPPSEGNGNVNSRYENTNTQVNTNTTGDLQSIENDHLVRVKFPAKYRLTQNTREPNRRGSYVSYDVTGGELMDEVQFFTIESVTEFNEGCKNTMCFEGDYPTIERFKGLQTAYENGTSYQDYTLVSIGNEKYLVKNIRVVTDSGYIREYNAFVGTTMVTIWAYIQEAAESPKADALIAPWQLEYTGF